MTGLEYAPRAQIADWLTDGWRLIRPVHEYAPGEYAVLMEKPPRPEPLTARQIATIAAQFTRRHNLRGKQERRCIETEWRVPQKAKAPDFGPLFGGQAA